jgi:ectoine hydroxylase-related dioxygenase (phytanoyl-CoA dioxygenase family)
MQCDLAQQHSLVTDLFALPTTPEEWEVYRLSEEQVEFYREWGYLPNVRLLSARQVDVLRIELAELTSAANAKSELWYEYHSNESTDPNRVLFHALGAWRLAPAFHDLLWHPAFTVAASQLLEGSVRFWHDQLFCKPAQHGGVVAWHQDYSYWTRTQPMAHLTCWIGLDNSTLENGCVHYVPGSHRWELLPITGLAGDMVAIRNELSDEQWTAFEQPVAVELCPGECTFHHPLMVHGSFENRSNRPRRATVINAFRDGVCSADDDPLLPGVPAIPAAQPMGGPFFPLLLDPVQWSTS